MTQDASLETGLQRTGLYNLHVDWAPDSVDSLDLRCPCSTKRVFVQSTFTPVPLPGSLTRVAYGSIATIW